MNLPKCGIYRTTEEIAGVPAQRLVYFHNHGNPGPGIYVPSGWESNRAVFTRKGRALKDVSRAHTLVALDPEGFYRVVHGFDCCQKKCRTYDEESLVQLGYNASAQPILFVPTWTAAGLRSPERGHLLDLDHLAHIAPLRVAVERQRHGEAATPLH